MNPLPQLLRSGPAVTDRPLLVNPATGWARVAIELRPLLQNVSEVSSDDTLVSPRDLYRQLLLHLPRFEHQELYSPALVCGEATRLASKLANKRRELARWIKRPQIPTLRKSDACIRECSPEIARQLHEKLHYIGTYRDGVHLGLFLPQGGDIPVALATLSEMDIKHLDHIYNSVEEKQRVLVVSRMFAFDWAPRNTMSFLLGRVARWIRKRRPSVRTLLTYVNPNLGFTGSSYAAANWNLCMHTNTAYWYLGDDYITYRILEALPEVLRSHVHRSKHDLEPLRIYSYAVRT
jgi:hypothetical protein